jgi:Zn-dependent membrane protease YugP
MEGNFSESNDCSSWNYHTNQLEWMVEVLQLPPVWESILLTEQQHKMTGIEVARTLLRNCGRTDVKVCCTKNQQNCYSPLLNLVGLSQDVANSRSVMAAAIAAHEIGHAFQPRSAAFGDLFIVLVRWFKPLYNALNSYPARKQAEPVFTLRFRVQQFELTLDFRRRIHSPSIVEFLRKLIYFAVIILLIPILALIALLLVCRSFVCNLLIFLIELQASWAALRLLKQHKILDARERRAARKFLFAAALTYLRSPNFDFI